MSGRQRNNKKTCYIYKLLSFLSVFRIRIRIVPGFNRVCSWGSGIMVSGCGGSRETKKTLIGKIRSICVLKSWMFSLEGWWLLLELTVEVHFEERRRNTVHCNCNYFFNSFVHQKLDLYQNPESDPSKNLDPDTYFKNLDPKHCFKCTRHSRALFPIPTFLCRVGKPLAALPLSLKKRDSLTPPRREGWTPPPRLTMTPPLARADSEVGWSQNLE